MLFHCILPENYYYFKVDNLTGLKTTYFFGLKMKFNFTSKNSNLNLIKFFYLQLSSLSFTNFLDQTNIFTQNLVIQISFHNQNHFHRNHDNN